MKKSICFCLVSIALQLGCTDRGSTPNSPSNQLPDLWNQTSLRKIQVRSMVVAPIEQLYVGTADSALYTSTDNGESFHPVNDGWGPNEHVTCLALGMGGYLYIGTNHGAFYRSSDLGHTWSLTNSSSGAYRCIYAGASGEVMASIDADPLRRSTDFGSNWHDIPTPSTVLAVTRTHDASLLIGTYDGIYKSVDMGIRWSQDTTGPGDIVGTFAVASSGDVFAASYQGIFRSTDNGNSWKKTDFPIHDLAIYSLAVNINDLLVVGAYNHGVFTSIDLGSTWHQDQSGLSNLLITCVAVTNGGVVYAGTDTSGLFRTTN
jgi:photosystem II stability/assembly factor-like uncharacterized protein